MQLMDEEILLLTLIGYHVYLYRLVGDNFSIKEGEGCYLRATPCFMEKLSPNII